MSSNSITYDVSIKMETRREFALLGGWQYDHYLNRYYNTYLYVDSKKSREVNIPVGIPNKATDGMVNELFVRISDHHEYDGPSEPQFTTVVSVPTSIKQVSQVDISAQDVAVRGNYAFVATGPDGLHVLDVTDPTKPTEIADYGQQGATWQVATEGSYIYAILVNPCDDPSINDWTFCRSSNSYVLDVSDPTKPVEVGRYNLPDYTYPEEEFEHREGAFHKLKVFGNYAYVNVMIAQSQGRSLKNSKF